MNTTRIDWIDTCKGIGILFVILGHTPGVPTELIRFIYSFHMPLFFIIHGYLWNRNKYILMSVNQIIHVKFQHYIIPYFKIAIVCFIPFGIIVPLLKVGFGEIFIDKIIKFIGGILYSRGTVEFMPNCSPIWFLTCLFCAEVIFIFIMKFGKYQGISGNIYFIIGYYWIRNNFFTQTTLES
jgi:fucose 4-O-acetylase-like acetyltransferase